MQGFLQGNRKATHITPTNCLSGADAIAAAEAVRRRRALFFAKRAEPVKATPVQRAKPQPATFVPVNIEETFAVSFPQQPCLKADTVNGSIAAPEILVKTHYTIDEIQRAMCAVSGCPRNDMLSPRRTRAVAEPRQMAMMLCKFLTHRSLPEIGRKFDGKDHTTVLHAVRKYEWMIQKFKVSVSEGSSALEYATAAWALYKERKAEKAVA